MAEKWMPGIVLLEIVGAMPRPLLYPLTASILFHRGLHSADSSYSPLHRCAKGTTSPTTNTGMLSTSFANKLPFCQGCRVVNAVQGQPVSHLGVFAV
jgi:hypothetical protein